VIVGIVIAVVVLATGMAYLIYKKVFTKKTSEVEGELQVSKKEKNREADLKSTIVEVQDITAPKQEESDVKLPEGGIKQNNSLKEQSCVEENEENIKHREKENRSNTYEQEDYEDDSRREFGERVDVVFTKNSNFDPVKYNSNPNSKLYYSKMTKAKETEELKKGISKVDFNQVIPLMSVYDALSSGQITEVSGLKTEQSKISKKIKFQKKSVLSNHTFPNQNVANNHENNASQADPISESKLITLNEVNRDTTSDQDISRRVFTPETQGLTGNLRGRITEIHSLKKQKENLSRNSHGKSSNQNEAEEKEGSPIASRINDSIKSLLKHKRQVSNPKNESNLEMLFTVKESNQEYDLRYSEPEDNKSIEIEKSIIKQIEVSNLEELEKLQEGKTFDNKLERNSTGIGQTKTYIKDLVEKKIHKTGKKKKKACKVSHEKLFEKGMQSGNENVLKYTQAFLKQFSKKNIEATVHAENSNQLREDWEEVVEKESYKKKKSSKKFLYKERTKEHMPHPSEIHSQNDDEDAAAKEEKERREFLVKTMLLQNFVTIPEEDQLFSDEEEDIEEVHENPKTTKNLTGEHTRNSLIDKIRKSSASEKTRLSLLKNFNAIHLSHKLTREKEKQILGNVILSEEAEESQKGGVIENDIL